MEYVCCCCVFVVCLGDGIFERGHVGGGLCLGQHLSADGLSQRMQHNHQMGYAPHCTR